MPTMRVRAFPVAAAILGLVLSGCVSAPQTHLASDLQSKDAEILAFGPPVVVDPSRVGREPSLIVDQRGAFYICSYRGVGDGTDVWRSQDGQHFDFIGQEVHPFLPVVRSGQGDAGGGDCDLGVDEGGRVYLADLWEGSVSVSSTADQGSTWTGTSASVLAPPLDRPWILGGKQEEVFLSALQLTNIHGIIPGNPTTPAGGVWVVRSTDGGKTFPQQVLAVRNDEGLLFRSNLALYGDNLYFVYESNKYGTDGKSGELTLMLASSPDRGLTWQHFPIVHHAFVETGCFTTMIFPVIAADAKGNLYAAWALNNSETKRFDLVFSSSSDGGKTWTPPLILTDRPGTRAYPWITAGGTGRVGLIWYETNVTLAEGNDPQSGCSWANAGSANPEWFVHFGYSFNAVSADPTFNEVLLDPHAVHKGSLDRPFAELMQVRIDPQGRAAAAYVADVPEGNARPMFSLQSTGPSFLS